MEPKLDALIDLQHKLRLKAIKPGVLNEEDLKLIYDFTRELTQKFGGFIGAVVLFGSRAREGPTAKSDLDLLVIVDDVTTPITHEIISAYRLGAGEILARLNAVDRIHLTTIGISDWFDAVMHADPIAINILRDGKPIVENMRFFEPLKRLLLLGRIRPSKEAIDAYLNRAKALVNLVDLRMLTAIDDLYWACISAAHALLMHEEIEVPSPKDIVDVFKNELVKKISVEEKHIRTLDEMINLMKAITRREKRTAAPEEVDECRRKVQEFIDFVEREMKS
ncbi:MAG: nucleotidyltransferase domain-containing protein [Candidatus Nanoarchaeia archaeon]|nr:nucleotidyltransferase domain-containing protein [Candidatus Haiyanarchaeum thermophilum]MCW1302854.1 nucleotidyltransferase domain-containing protein [Candidatus Haiyanarchaeum thermophilum]MCW1303534.1 nucleotidyltransferase domain-containing protein [Candidatus Haiyanarchaeum thermophilum]MCW1307330.1 nucleotidyltransferase domain-containing protein [Candidatus Haiyanarchaeum thermophilum]MCW1307946.1 nucleotidyltransferase domain-containing protein [Candidatus Haiyanarchaeum thermophilum